MRPTMCKTQCPIKMSARCLIRDAWFAAVQWIRSRTEGGMYMQRSTPRDEPEYITRLRKEAYENGLNAGCLLFNTPAVSQAAACDGTSVTTSATGQELHVKLVC